MTPKSIKFISAYWTNHLLVNSCADYRFLICKQALPPAVSPAILGSQSNNTTGQKMEWDGDHHSENGPSHTGRALTTDIHHPQKVLGQLLQWKLHDKHQIRNAISRQRNVVRWWNFLGCMHQYSLKDNNADDEIYIYYCITWWCNLFPISIGLTFKAAFYGESDFIHFIFDS